MTPPLLTLREVTHRFGTTLALDHAGIEVPRGRVHAVLGENGAGKTSLMRVAFGMIAPDAGEVLVEGRPVRLQAPADAIAHGIGMVHQHFTLVPRMTVAENIALGGRGTLDLAHVARDVTALGDASGLRIDPWRTVADLSIAEQQRVEILKAISRNARILILDEPTAVLAPAEADELLQWLRRHVERGHAVVLITHKLAEALTIADDVTVLRRGRVALGGEAATLSVNELATAMLGEADTPPAPRHPTPEPAASHDVVAAIDGVSATRGREGIADASIVLRGGEITGIAGIEGSGHHVLLGILAGRIAPAAGVVRIPPRIGYVPEDRLRDALIADASITANVALKGAGARRGRMHWQRWRERAVMLVGRHDVRGTWTRDPARTPVRTLSGGNQQKLVLARELDEAPQLIVAENPTRGLDIRAAAAVLARLREAAAGGAAVVVYTADLDEVIAMSDRIFAVHAGRVRECAPDRAAVGRAMLGLA